MYVRDSSGNVDSCRDSIAILDTIPAAAVCAYYDTLLYLDSNGIVTLDSDALSGNSSDTCGIDSIWLSMDTFMCSQAGDTVVVYNFIRDSSGNVDSCRDSVVIMDTIKPTAMCINNDTMLYLDANGLVVLDSNALDNNSMDNNCALDSVWLSQDTFRCSDAGDTIVVYLYVRDSSGNTDSCRDSVMITDTIPPTATCLADTDLYLSANGPVVLDSNALDDSSTDNCGDIAAFAIAIDSFDCAYADSTIAVETYVIDEADLIDSCQTMVRILDTTPPTVMCPADTAIALGAGMDRILVEGLDTVATWDNCSLTVTNDHNQTANASDTFRQASTEVTYTVTDPSNNEGECSFTVTLYSYPVAVDDGVFMHSGSIDDVLSENVYANDSHVFYANTELMYELVDGGSLSNNGTINFSGDGTFTFTRSTGSDTGTFSFSYRVCDTATDLSATSVTELCDTAMVSVRLAALPPEAITKETAVTFNGEVTGNVEDYVNFNGTQESITIVTAPKNGTFTVDDNGDFVYQANKGYIGLDNVTYKVCNQYGLCTDITQYFDTRCAMELRDDVLSIPNLLTPNNDGSNDEWVIEELEDLQACYDYNEVIVFNRWEVKIFHKQDYGKDGKWWNGTVDGDSDKKLPAGTYFYILVIDGAQDKAYTGFLHLQY